MPKVKDRIALEKPVKELWNYLTNFENIPTWAGVHETKPTSTDMAGVGITFQNTGLLLERNSVQEHQVA